MWKLIALALLVPFAAQAGDNNTVLVAKDGKVRSSKDGDTHALVLLPGGNVTDRRPEYVALCKTPAERMPAGRIPAERAATEK